MGIQGGAPKRAQKIAAIAAAGVVLLGGATITSLAAWTDIEFVQGGVGDDPGISTSEFEVEQMVATDVAWQNREVAPGGVVDFGLGALSLTPGDVVYGYVQLRTAPGSLAGDLELQGATSDGALFDALTYGVRIVPTTGDCNATGFDASVTGVVDRGNPLSDDFDNAFTLDANATEINVICFEIVFSEDNADNEELQGLTTTPVWSFEAESN